ncbi:MAG: hypothetical protein BWK73_42610 [Thiothrix lacustris]|uniref:Uncharacterized protein n=1 Tax=Thiothrix lacustris TaxID=525917 RepID=A0A1Y1QCB2_9GAMM|nr:MAG: hypothetical protein BWK73_42610 [Thiothrix lacustris]
MYMQLNEQFIVDERGSKQAAVIPFANYLKMLEMLRRQDEPPNANNLISIWQTDKGSAQGVRAWLAADDYNDYPVGNSQHLEQTVQEIRDAWGDE